jgi:DNA-directed RNA polymerase specialized sigma24 family protein
VPALPGLAHRRRPRFDHAWRARPALAQGQDAENPDAYDRGILTHAWLDERRRPWRREHATAWLPEAAAVVVLRFYCDLSVARRAEPRAQ